MSPLPARSAAGPVHSSKAIAFLWRSGGLIVSLALTVAVGLISRRHPIGLRLYDRSLGDVLYAVAAYQVLALLRPRWPAARVAGAALGLCFAVELFQLTGIPARYASIPAVRWLLGTQFAWEDIECYLIGVAAVAGVDSTFRRRHRSQARYER